MWVQPCLYSVLKTKFSEQRTNEIINFIVTKRDSPLEFSFAKKRWKSEDTGGILGEFTSKIGYLYFTDVAMLLRDGNNNEGLTIDEFRLISDIFTVRSNGYRIYAEGKLVPIEKDKNFAFFSNNKIYYFICSLFRKLCF